MKVSRSFCQLLRRSVAPLLVALTITVTVGCKSEGGGGGSTIVMSCLISDDQKQPRQCFEYNEAPDQKARRMSACSNFEGSPAFTEGPCPTQGRVGSCKSTVAGKTTVEVAYKNPEAAQKRCASSSGTFTPN